MDPNLIALFKDVPLVGIVIAVLVWSYRREMALLRRCIRRDGRLTRAMLSRVIEVPPPAEDDDAPEDDDPEDTERFDVPASASSPRKG